MALNKVKREFSELFSEFHSLLIEKEKIKAKWQETEHQRSIVQDSLKEKEKQLEMTMVVAQNTKLRLENFEQQCNDIKTQNYKLAVRGATAFNELTPRYTKFKQIFDEFKI